MKTKKSLPVFEFVRPSGILGPRIDSAYSPEGKRFLILFMTLFLVSLYYAISTRTVEDVIKIVMVPSLIIWAISLIVGTAFLLDREVKLDRFDTVNTIIGYSLNAPLLIATSLMLYYLLLTAPIDLVYWLLEGWTWNLSSIAITATATLIAGSVLFYFRLKARVMYGLSEALAGLSIASYKFVEIGEARALTDPNFFMVVLTAGVYLVVRGFDNVHQGLTREPIDQFTLQFLHKWAGFRHRSRAKLERVKWPSRIKLGLARDRLRIKQIR